MNAAEHRRAGEAGFTIIEIVVAIGLVGLVLALSATAHRVISGAGLWGARTVDRLDMTSRSLAAMRRDLQRIERAVGQTGAARDRFVFVGDKQAVSFVVIEPPYPTEAGAYQVSYRVRRTKEGAQLLRARRLYDPDRRPSGRDDDTASDDAVVVVEGPYAMTFSYLDRQGDRSKWGDRWSQPRRLPALIRFEAKSQAAGVPNLPVLIVQPRIDAEIACLNEGARLCTPRTGGVLSDLKAATATEAKAPK